MILLVVGPSGAGKDSLLSAAREVFRGDARISFVRRVITRPPDAGAEDHEPATEAEFAARDFALSWSTHGLRYGIPAEAIKAAPVVVANVSRGVIAEAASRYAVSVIEVTAPPDVLAARLAARGRESAGDVASRLSRVVAIPGDVPLTTVMNDGSLAQGVERFVAAIRLGLADADNAA
jgi:phosphonate metabolism protein PhnN/1,5-bisphosphokinase (PRPP-forming)